jgi:ribosomal protection tetracycline resistance protein
MSRRTLNLGILAHVDAGKTTLSERLLYAAGVIDEIGSVDDGTTQTDSLALERQRGITIKSAVVSFAIGDVTVNLIDTPGHPDFIAEVERVLSVLDGAVLVISAVEGVQAQTRVLMRALQRLRIPTLLFVNKIDRAGADDARVLREISDRLGLVAVPMGRATGLGARDAQFRRVDGSEALASVAEVLAERNDRMLAAYVFDPGTLSGSWVSTELAAQTGHGAVYPVFFGSAITGAGVNALMAAIPELLPVAAGDATGPVAGRVFKIERGASGEKIAYVRMFSGTVCIRDRLAYGNGQTGKVTAVTVFGGEFTETGVPARSPVITGRSGAAARGKTAAHAAGGQRTFVTAGEIGKLWGLQQIQIGDQIGPAGVEPTTTPHQFAPPALETVVVAEDPGDRARLRVALGQLAEQDPLINVRQDDAADEISVSLYGEVQKEVIEATLASDFGIRVGFREVTTIYIERPVGSGQAVEVLQSDAHPFSATVGLRVEPAAAGSGVEFRLELDPRQLPLYIYKNTADFSAAMSRYVQRTLQEGLHGWQVTDCVVTMNRCGYYIGDGPTKHVLPTPRTSAADFSKLTPMVLMTALDQAGTIVCEPMTTVSVEVPATAVGVVLAEIARLGAAATPAVRGDLAVIETLLPAARVQQLQRQVPGLTGGEGVVETTFGGYQPVIGSRPSRRRTTVSPLNRDEYLARVTGRAPHQVRVRPRAQAGG